MTSYKRVLWKANIRFFVATILGIIIPISVVAFIDLLLHTGITASSYDTLFASPLILIYTSPIWLGICLLGYLTDLMIVPQGLSLRRYLLVEWLLSTLIPLWPIIDNFSIHLPERWVIYVYFILLAFPCFYLKAKYLAQKGLISNSVV